MHKIHEVRKDRTCERGRVIIIFGAYDLLGLALMSSHAKRILPSLTSLAAFEAAARRTSFTRAAEELGLTQSAISRQVSQLEGFLGVKLFERIRQRVVLTQAGVSYAAKIRNVLDQAQAATLDVLASKSGGKVLHICSLATFASHWLSPRMGSFARAYPDIDFRISSYHHLNFSTLADDVDVAIHYGEPSWPDALVDRLMDEEVVPVCSPAYANSIGLDAPAAFARATLLQQTTRPDAWTDLLAPLHIAGLNALRGPRFELYSMLIEAAIAGIGVGAIPRFLVEDHLATGRLIVPVPCSVRSRHTYCLIYPEAKRQQPEIQAFRSWIQREARKAAASQRQSAPERHLRAAY
jgi:LysR family transcriptional regulator, glycine cleavage system transcriptional activator